MNKAAKARAAALLAAGVVGGGVLAGTLSATAATGTTTAPAPGASSSTTAPPGALGAGRPMGPGGASPVRSDETLVTGADLTTLQAAALEAVPGGTIIRVETDSGAATYEAHMKKADGSLVTVTFGKDLAVTAVEDGMGE